MKEPLNLPNGSVRALLALIALGVSSFLWVTGQPLPNELLIITSSSIAYYYGTRGTEEPRDPPLPEPYLEPEA